MPTPGRRLLPVAVFTLAYLLVGIAFAVRRWNPEFIFYGAVMAVQVAGVVWLHLRTRLPAGLLWALSLWGLAHMMGGSVPIPESVAEPGRVHVLYNLRLHPNLPKFDQVVHFYGFFVATLVAWHALRAAAPGLRPTLGPLLGAALIGAGLGAVNEVIEFAATRIFVETNVGGYDNTGWDLVANALGAACAAVGIRLGWRRTLAR